MGGNRNIGPSTEQQLSIISRFSLVRLLFKQAIIINLEVETFPQRELQKKTIKK